MDLLSKSDEEIFAIGKPFWENLVRSSNMKDYGGFTRDFSTQMLFGANEVELGKQWSNNEKINASLELEKKRPKIQQKLILGGSWTPFGRGLGWSWASFGCFWPSLGRFLAIKN